MLDFRFVHRCMLSLNRMLNFRMFVPLFVFVLQAKSNFFDFGGSLQFVKLAATIKEELNVTIPLAALLKQPTLAGVSETLAAENEATAEAEFDAQMEADKFPLKEGRPPVQTAFEVLAAARGKSTKSVLVTGSTGWLGAFVVKRLAKDSHVNQAS